MDLWIYQEIIWQNKPDLLIETGTAFGGSALFFASVFDLLKNGRVISIDLYSRNVPKHKRIEYLVGSSTDREIIKTIKRKIKNKEKVMVVLDSDHTKNHVLEELKLYSKLVSPGQYLIVEDTIINGHPVYKDFGPGPYEAIKEFLKININFEIDKCREKFLISNNLNGFLKKVKQ